MTFNYLKLSVLCALISLTSFVQAWEFEGDQDLCKHFDRVLASTAKDMSRRFQKTMKAMEQRVAKQVNVLNKKITGLERELVKRDEQFIKDQERIQREMYSSLVKAKVRDEIGRQMNRGGKSRRLLQFAENEDKEDDEDDEDDA